jgi:hypothetical protein
MVRFCCKLAAVVWASPYSLFGLVIGALGLLSGGRASVRDGILEFSGGAVSWFVRHLPSGPTTMAITLGHVVLGQTPAALDLSRQHELVHVRQYSLWGPLFGPAYVLCSLVIWLRGGRPYLDNPFEVEAYRVADIDDSRDSSDSWS